MSKQIETVEVMGSDGKIYNRVPCEVYTRVMGYIRPMSGRNKGKLSEGMSRKYFTEERINNSPFIRRWSIKESLAN